MAAFALGPWHMWVMGVAGLVQATELEGRFGDGNWGPWVEMEFPLLPPLAAPQGLSLSHLKSCPLTDLGHSQAYSVASSSP